MRESNECVSEECRLCGYGWFKKWEVRPYLNIKRRGRPRAIMTVEDGGRSQGMQGVQGGAENCG